MDDQRAFTLIELLIVLVIISILTTIAIINFGSTKEEAFKAAMRSDLRNIASAEEAFYINNSTYTDSLGALDFVQSENVTIAFTTADVNGWEATATHVGAPGITCTISYGDEVGAGEPAGSVICTEA